VKRLAATLATIGRIALPYFRSEDRWPGRILLGSVIGLELSVVAIHVILNYWYNGFYNTLQDRNWSGFVQYILFFCVLATIYTVVVVYQNYLNLWLQIRWRRWMTQTYLRQWLNTANHYRMQLLGDTADNPDQRIADDLQMFVQETLSIGIGLLNSVVTLCSFVFILWNLSEKMPLHLFGVDIAIPGYLIWGAVVYAVIGTVLTHLIGWPLIPLNFQRQRFEADFRFNLVRTRENSEQVAALRGEAAERERHIDRFSRIRRELDRDHAAAEEAHVLYAELFAGDDDLSLFDGGAGLFRVCRRAARRPDADRLGFPQRAECNAVFRLGLSKHRPVSGGGETLVRL